MFDNLIFYIVALVVDCCAAIGWGIIGAMFMSNIMDIKKRVDGDSNLDSIPATLTTAVVGGIIGLVLSIWLYWAGKPTGAVLSNLVAFTVIYIIAMFILTVIYKRIKNAQPTVKTKGKYPRQW